MVFLSRAFWIGRLHVVVVSMIGETLILRSALMYASRQNRILALLHVPSRTLQAKHYLFHMPEHVSSASA
jgi:hypothetical protein